MNRYAVTTPMNIPAITLGAYVARAFSLMPAHVLREAFDRRDVKMNGLRAARGARVLPGVEVALYTHYEAVLSVLYEDARLLAIDKPAGVSADADALGSLTVLDWAARQAGGAYQPYLCHRLDNQTSGLMLLAKDEGAQAALQAMFAAGGGQKEYECLVRGAPSPAQGTFSAWLLKDAARARVKVLPRPVARAKPIETAYKTVERGDISRLRVMPRTGRTHQIRAHLAYLGHPILGDDLYGDRDFNRAQDCPGLMLRSISIRLNTDGILPEIDGLTISAKPTF